MYALVFCTVWNTFGGSSLSASDLAACEITEIVQRPWMINDGGQLKSETELVVENDGESFDGWVKISIEGMEPYMQAIGVVGKERSEVIVDVAELQNDGDSVSFEIYNNEAGDGKAVAALSKPQKKIRHWKVYVAHDMHLDIGYTNDQEQLNNSIFPGYLDDAFRNIQETDTWEDHDRFKYPIESSYMLYDAARNAKDADWFETLKNNLKNGSMSYPNSYVNIVYGGLGTEQLARINYYSARHLKDQLGVSPNEVLHMTDSPGFSWAAVDAMVESGVKYAMLRQNPDPLIPYPKLFYYQGKVANHQLLTYNYGHYSTDELDFRNSDSNMTFEKATKSIMDYHNESYPYDAIVTNFTTPYDNQGITAAVKDNIKSLNAKKDSQGRDYVYPQFISSTVSDYFSYIEDNYKDEVPAFKGNMEDWWNYGVSSTSAETAINKENHDKLPAAELYATMANLFTDHSPYPYEDIATAYKNMIIYDEHSWGSEFPKPDDQWRWKRNNAITANQLSDQVMENSLTALSKEISTNGPEIAVYNALSWVRSDVVEVDAGKLPKHFDIVDKETGKPVKYEKRENGTVAFVASNIKGLGYKMFSIVQRKDDPLFHSNIKTTSNTIENDYFKVTFNETGAIQSILDKSHGNKEMVDQQAPYQMNDYVYFTTKKMSHDVLTTHEVESSELTKAIGPVSGTMTALGKAVGVNDMKRNVVLYDEIPRIDIVNQVEKSDAPSYQTQDEEAFFVFPLNVPQFMLRHEMPSGDVRPYVNADINNPDNEQFYSSSTAYYTVNRWIDASNQTDYGITMSLLSNPIVQYGERRSAIGPWDYNTAKPWIYNYVFNNKWHVNFQKTQPGPVTFKYSLTSHEGSDWKQGRADQFGMEVNNALRASVISEKQKNRSLQANKGQFLSIDQDHVVLTAAKSAESNGEGIILRFNETLGMDTDVTVDLSMFNPRLVAETDLVENDKQPLKLTRGKVTFRIEGHGWKTIRVELKGKKPNQVKSLSAKTDTAGTLVDWKADKDDNGLHYELFRGTTADFEPGAGSYLTAMSSSHFYDQQVKSDRKQPYYYKVRAVKGGLKGDFSISALTEKAQITDKTAPSEPKNVSGYVQSDTRISLAWNKSIDNVDVKGYKIYRNGDEIRDVSASYNSYLDTEAKGGEHYAYTVKAYDFAGNLSRSNNEFAVTTPPPQAFNGNIASMAAVSASSQFNDEYGAAKVIDDVYGIHGSGEWASSGELNPWIQLEWPSEVEINKIVLYDRVNLADHAMEGKLLFSDGTFIGVSDIPNDGMDKIVAFDRKKVKWVKFEVTKGAGANVGLSEFQVFEAPSLPIDTR
ncbi:glycosyl hydrolase-related protein [Bacillus sp. FJAT-28004]|uniref:DUF7402 domain-containing protein n=1 Tax=Bacillus sp. FJAT-28004 TaxID=1679165 RepID=UPI0006B50494|nr:discoidin domain-containing protein [Bacillus sp. FJAT-28004]